MIRLLLISIFCLCTSCVSNHILKHYSSAEYSPIDTTALVTVNDSLHVLAHTKDYLVRNKYGNWELYVSGNPDEIGDKMGLLSGELIQAQRRYFMDKLEDIVPSPTRRKWIMRFVHWYNRRLDNYIPEQYLTEMYALSRHMDSSYAFAGSPFQQTLYMHAAHDLGHALQDLAIVGCSSAASWGAKTPDGELLIGRNFDFYLSDDFSKNKVIYFVRPEKGIPFMSVSWPGMVGVVSGMNLEGLTITMNAGKSVVPLSAKTPISLIALEILEHASTIEEAIAIAKNRKPFVSESLMIGSAKDHKAVLLELSPKNFGVYDVTEQQQLICTNHFQSAAYNSDKRNTQHIRDSHSQYRHEHLQELLAQKDPLTPSRMVDILRDRKGLHDEDIGLGNDKSLTHLLAHHAVVFQPEKKRVWVSNSPYQLGAFTAYDLRKVFADSSSRTQSKAIDSLTIAADPFLQTAAYRQYEQYRQESARIEHLLKSGTETLSPEDIENYKALNPKLWYVYYLSGQYQLKEKNYGEALADFEAALDKEIPTAQARRHIEQLRNKAKKKWKR